MEARVAGALSNASEAVREVRHIYPDAPKPGIYDGIITSDMLLFMENLVEKNNSRALFLWLLKITLEITAPVYWWNQCTRYFQEIEWVRRHPRETGERALLQQDDFEGGIPTLLLETMNEQIADGARAALSDTIPDSFYRRGYVHTNYAELRKLYSERGHYNKGHWSEFSHFLRDLTYANLLTAGL